MPSQAERSRATRRSILDAARALFAAQGWAATPIDEVVRAAGVTKGALYHHFRDKTDLLRAVYEEQEQRSIDGLLALSTEHDDPLDALRAGCRAFLTACLDPTFRRIALVEAPAGLGWEEWREIDARYGFGLLRAGVELAMDAGRLRRMPLDPLAHLLLAALSEAALLLGRAEDAAAKFDEVVESFDALLDGLETRPPEVSFHRLVDADLPMLHRWLNEPGVVRWWEGDDVLWGAVVHDYGSTSSDSTEHWIASTGGRAIGWIQCYAAAEDPEETGQWWALGVDPLAAGIDYLIGEPADRGRGLGSAMIRAFLVDVVFGLHPAWPQAAAAPYAQNVASWRALEKAGFRFAGTVEDDDGPCRLMVADRSTVDPR